MVSMMEDLVIGRGLTFDSIVWYIEVSLRNKVIDVFIVFVGAGVCFLSLIGRELKVFVFVAVSAMTSMPVVADFIDV